MAVAEKPDVRRDCSGLDVGFERGADSDRRYDFGEAPDVLGGEVVSMVWSGVGGHRCKHGVADADYVVSSRHVPAPKLERHR